MYYCDNCDIAHEDRYCPLCEANAEIKNLVKRIEALESEE